MGGPCCYDYPCRCRERYKNYMEFHATSECICCQQIVSKTFIHQGSCGRCSAQRKMRNRLIDHFKSQLKNQINCTFLVRKVIFYLNEDLKKDYEKTKELHTALDLY